MGKIIGWLLIISILVFSFGYFYYNKTGYKFGLENTFLFKGKIGVSTLSFTEGGEIPKKYTCDGEDISPEFTFTRIPEETKSLAFVLEDESTQPTKTTHWIVFNYKSDFNTIDSASAWQYGTVGVNDFGNKDYNGPCPEDDKTHKYTFKIYALNNFITSEEQNRISFDKMITGHILSTGSIIGTYSRISDDQ